jgi:hypothetical protein
VLSIAERQALGAQLPGRLQRPAIPEWLVSGRSNLVVVVVVIFVFVIVVVVVVVVIVVC